MGENTTRVRLPALPELDVFQDPSRTIRTDSGDALLTYDPATQSALIYNARLARWSITSPIDFETFVMTALASGFVISDSADAQRWLAANATPMHAGAVN